MQAVDIRFWMVGDILQKADKMTMAHSIEARVPFVDKEVYKLPLGMYRTYTPGIDTPITLLWFAKTAYPEMFEDVDLVKETRAYYQDIFGIQLSDEQIKSIYNPDANAGRTYFN